MKSKKQIEAKISELQKDDCMTQPLSNIQINAPLALIQLEIGSRIQALMWVLKES